jgi:hypothetical protein
LLTLPHLETVDKAIVSRTLAKNVCFQRAYGGFGMNINSINAFLQRGMTYLAHMSPTGWFVGLVVTLLVGIACMRGFGSRADF